MKTTITMGVLGAIALTTAAQGTPFQGFTLESMGDMGYGETVRLYANIDAGTRIDAVFGNSEGALSISVEGGSFYQNTNFGGPTSTSINSAFFPLAPSLEWDSYVSIGALYSSGAPFANNALLDIGIDWASFEGGGELATSNGSWFVTPVDPQGGELNGMVFIGQFTMVGGSGLIGQVSFQGKDADGNTWQELGVTWVPAPGAMALLGLAGLAGRRRRR